MIYVLIATFMNSSFMYTKANLISFGDVNNYFGLYIIVYILLFNMVYYGFITYR